MLSAGLETGFSHIQTQGSYLAPLYWFGYVQIIVVCPTWWCSLPSSFLRRQVPHLCEGQDRNLGENGKIVIISHSSINFGHGCLVIEMMTSWIGPVLLYCNLSRSSPGNCVIWPVVSSLLNGEAGEKPRRPQGWNPTNITRCNLGWMAYASCAGSRLPLELPLLSWYSTLQTVWES